MSLHVHSEYSSLDGWSTVDEIGDRMLEIECPFCGLTDHGVVSGHIEFDKAMRKRDLKPVFGCELYHGINFKDTFKAGERDQAHLIALAVTDEGLRNLWRLVNATADRSKFHNVGRVSCDDILRFQEGVIFTSACPLGLVPRGLLKGDTTWFNWYLENLKDKFRVEVTTYPGDVIWADRDSDGETYTPRLINEMLVDVAQERGVPITYGDDGHYAFPGDFELHDMYLASQTKQSIYTPVDERKMYHPPEAVCIKDEATVRENLSYLPDSVVDDVIANTWEIGVMADAHLPSVDRPHMPLFVSKECPWVKEEKDATTLFIDLVEEGIQRIYGGTEREEEAWDRAAREMEVLIEDGLEHYFLMAWDLMQFCDVEGINRGPGRGSAAGCIVAYALGITDVDPLHYDLYFERFWNKGRTDGFPDIDSDFAPSRREDIREYLIKRWGEKKVCSIGNVTRMKPLAVIDKLATACGITFEEKEELKKIVAKTRKINILGHKQIGWNPENEPGKVYYVKTDVGEEIDKWVGADTRKAEFINMCERACSRTSTYGIHASGIVISDIDLDDYAPAHLRGGKTDGIPATMFPMKVIEALKLIKLDVLGLKTLDTLAEWERQMAEKGVDIEWSGLDMEEWPEELWDLPEKGFVAGLFQIETPAGKAITEELKPRSVEDLGILVALNRPGPDSQEFLARRSGRKPVVYQHPMLEDILASTYGLFLYQEQIIRFMSELGYTLNDADAVRKILGKKEPEKLSAIFEGFNEWDKKGFLKVAMEHGFSEKIATEVWEDISHFAEYSFNKAHAIAYAIISFRCLVAKYYAPTEFYIACIRTVENSKRADLTPQYIKEAKRMGIEVLPPDIRYSQAEISVHDGNIYFGFSDVTNVSSSGPYVVYLRDEVGIDVSSPEKVCEEIEILNKEALDQKKQAVKDGNPFPKTWRSPKQQINQKKINSLYEAGAWDGLEERTISMRERQEKELEYLKVLLTDDTDEIIQRNWDAIENAPDDIIELSKPWSDKEGLYEWIDGDGDEIPMDKRYIIYKVPGIIADVKPTKVKKNGAAMGIVTIEWDGTEQSFACFSNKWKTNKFMFKPRNVGIFTIRHAPDERRGESYIFEEGTLLK